MYKQIPETVWSFIRVLEPVGDLSLQTVLGQEYFKTSRGTAGPRRR